MIDMLAPEDVCIFSLEDIGGDKLDLSLSSCISMVCVKGCEFTESENG